MVTAERKDRVVTRNSSHFKRISSECGKGYEDDVSFDIEEETPASDEVNSSYVPKDSGSNNCENLAPTCKSSRTKYAPQYRGT